MNRTIAITLVVAGAVASLAILFSASLHRPPALTALFAVWVVAPYVALLVTHGRTDSSPRRRPGWSVVTRIVVVGSVAVYALDAIHPLRAQRAFVYLVVPAIAWLLIAATMMRGAPGGDTTAARH